MTIESKRILVIDDEKEFCFLLAEYFTEKGYSVGLAYDGEDGIAKTKSFEPDIIILDMRMPVIDGPQVINQVRKFCNALIICVSAIKAQETIDECLKLGASEYIFIPINLEELERATESTFKRR